MDSSPEVFDLKRQPIRTSPSVNTTASKIETAVTSTEYVIKRKTRGRLNTSDYSSEDDVAATAVNNKSEVKNGQAITPVDLSNHQAYKLYKEAGEYWNKYPKTDYTYSKYSPHRRELAPGVIAMPNMSRRSIRSDDAYNYMTCTENYINTVKSRRFYIDGETPRARYENNWRRDTVDYYHVEETYIQKILRVTRITWLITIITNFVTSMQQQNKYKQRWYNKLWNSVMSIIHTIGSSYYLLLGYVLFTDTWLLTRKPQMQSRRTQDTTTTSQRKYLFYISLIVLIPLLLLFGWWLYNPTVTEILNNSLAKIHETATYTLESIIYSISSLFAMLSDTFTSIISLPLLWINSSHTVQNSPASAPENILKIDPNLMTNINLEQLNQKKIIQQERDEDVASQEKKIVSKITENIIESTTTLSEIEIKSIIADEMKDIRQDLENHRKFLADLIVQLNKLKEVQDNNLNQRIEEIKYEISNYVHVEIQKIMTTQEIQSKTIDSDELMKFKHELRKLEEALKVYDADKTGLPDFALESSGGQIISTRCTESYNAKTSEISIFGIPLWYPSNSPRVVITHGVVPGECWAFQGFPGFLVIKLSARIQITKFTLEHIPKIISPTGNIDSAPQNFSVWGLHNETELNPLKLGQYVYEDNGEPLQQFPVQIEDVPPFQMVELRIESNHGNIKFTCLYRFRVHGSIVNDIPPP